MRYIQNQSTYLKSGIITGIFMIHFTPAREISYLAVTSRVCTVDERPVLWAGQYRRTMKKIRKQARLNILGQQTRSINTFKPEKLSKRLRTINKKDNHLCPKGVRYLITPYSGYSDWLNMMPSHNDGSEQRKIERVILNIGIAGVKPESEEHFYHKK